MNRSNAGKVVTLVDKAGMALRTFTKNIFLSTIEPEANLFKSIECSMKPDLFMNAFYKYVQKLFIQKPRIFADFEST